MLVYLCLAQKTRQLQQQGTAGIVPITLHKNYVLQQVLPLQSIGHLRL